jgi:aspartate/methionine/tyrosine aminotransferase
MPFLRFVPPMGIYETLYAFLSAFGRPMGDAGTHPWSQGFPRTDQLPGGPPMPDHAPILAGDLKYPKAWGLPALREAIAAYYRTQYGTTLTADNVMVFAGGRPALMAILFFLERNISVRIAETEYTPYYDMLERLDRPWSMVPSHEANRFSPSTADYLDRPDGARSLILLSNPCNPTGVTRRGPQLRALVDAASTDHTGLLVDEAYELFQDRPESALQYVRDLDASNLFVTGAATKGLQAPGIRIGWAIASKKNIEVLGNFSSFGMGGVSHPSQRYALELLEPARMTKVRAAVPAFYRGQRDRYGAAFAALGLELFTGDGGFYHWCKLPAGLTAAELNQRLFKDGAAILKGTDCDMARRGDASPLNNFFRFSFGPLAPESFDEDIAILKRALAGT